LDWDESISQTIHTEWSNFTQQWATLDKISFERKILIENYRDVQLHGFCDASNNGYGACIYVRSEDTSGNVNVKILCAKSRVAPLKPVTIPRLELSGALLLTQLYQEVIGTLEILPDRIIFWCDSMIVLHWIKMSPRSFQTYVSNRVASIQEIAKSVEWRHVRSEDNPADAISRGQTPQVFLKNKMWRTGPSWLLNEEGEWPNEFVQICEIPELKKNICLVTNDNDFSILDKFASYTKLLRVVAYCLRFLPNHKNVGSLTAEEINKAEIRIIKILQDSRFAEEIKKLKNKISIDKGTLTNLNPFLDENGLIRVGGRLQNSQLSFGQKHPIILPSRHPLTDRIIREIHERHYHTGIQATLYILRQKFWLTDGRNQVRKIVRTYVRCFNFNANPVKYKMGNLPSSRVSGNTPFTNVGVDFCGPFFIKEKKHRNQTRVKAYVCVFVCMLIKAIHLEVVSDLTTEGFLAALRRFMARRGLPQHIHSDNGSNFIGAKNQLKELYVLLNSEDHKERVNNFAIERRVSWHFIPPFAPHFGGLWESSVKLFKHHLKRVVGDSLFTFEELNTLTTEIEGILNSRPISFISTDPNDLLVLSPAHFLIGRPITSLPDIDLTLVPVNRLSTWQHITKVRQDFWKRWNLEYLNELQMRNKWNQDGPKLSTNTIVLIKEKNLPCTQWAMGKIKEVFPGEDGIVRTAIVKTAAGEIKRAAKSLCPLPIEQ